MKKQTNTEYNALVCHFIYSFDRLLETWVHWVLPVLIANNRFKGALSYLRQILATEIPSKMMKNAFYFTLKAPLVLKLFIILFWLYSHVKNGVIKKLRLISKWRQNLVNKQLQCTYWPIYQKAKTISQETCSVDRM